ncbi:poly-gamma-glutamate hydrolase family protein [Actinoplanes sp. LDG1-06]|uniref:Poly-gamma-glutamate hydrolase family protein n=1 Tax=Paractinoplanes ovalisporus TaxID=2810368 RepID=A0ABS2A3H2_9ACTN|nr:poly-gamma-glutamate hydrolase family protein [Actinoplanes ovalisporus]MBM2614401.1 poly-gamma-glutamate hydrolase family protein [Actinoplanes ovalisporus]
MSPSRRSVLVALGSAAVVATTGRPAAAAEPESNTALYRDPRWTEGVDYARRFRRHAALDDSDAPGDAYPDKAVLALHGGGIEPGTSELCLAIAGYHPAGGLVGGAVYDYWMFEGIMPSGNSALHVTSHHCDDPVALATVRGSRRALSLHGCSPEQADLGPNDAAVLVGGLDTTLRDAMRVSLTQAFDGTDIRVFDAARAPELDGTNPRNIVNLSLRDAGVQFELTTPLRNRMFGTNTRSGRRNTTLDPFWRFANATRAALA